jgi:hypothetical protein
MTPDQQDARARALALARDRALALADDLARDRARTRALTDDRDLAGALALARNRAHALADDLNRARNRARAIDRALACAHALADALDRARDRADDLNLDRVGARAIDRALADDLNHARALVRTVDQVANPGRSDRGVLPGASSPGHARARRVALPARRLVAAAAGLVPAGERARYGEEYRSELHDLAASGAGRCRQLGYALRLLAGTLRLRRAVLAPRHGKAGP